MTDEHDDKVLKLRSPMRFTDFDWQLAELVARKLEKKNGSPATRATAFRLAIRRMAQALETDDAPSKPPRKKKSAN
jgi:hypothetical protein